MFYTLKCEKVTSRFKVKNKLHIITKAGVPKVGLAKED
jgi:hypothetical protein